MTTHQWTCALLLAILAPGPSTEMAFAEDLRELSRSVRWKHLTLQENRPDDLTVDLPHDVSNLRYAEWVYGTPDSPRVAIAIAETGNGAFVLYVDGNRNREIRARELVKGAGELRLLSLPAVQVVGDVLKDHPRKALSRWKGADGGLSVATATRIEHTIHPDGDETVRALQTRQIDGDANGLFADARDLLQIDLDHNGRFDPFLETFPFRPLMRFRGQRWFTKADRFGKRLRIKSATATGRVQVTAHARSQRDRITDLIVTLSGEDGSVYSLTGVDAITDLPVGRYAAAVLFVAIKPQGAEQAWEFTFSRDGAIRAMDWLHVREGETVEFDPIGDLVMDAVVERPKRKNARSLNVQPRVFTGSGLLINRCSVAGMRFQSGPQCQVSLTNIDNQSLAQYSSGFG